MEFFIAAAIVVACLFVLVLTMIVLRRESRVDTAADVLDFVRREAPAKSSRHMAIPKSRTIIRTRRSKTW